MPDAPITPDERAAMRERYAADLPSAWDTSAAAHARALRDLGTSARNDVPRLLGALDAAEAEVERLRADVARLTARPAPAPIPATGRLGLWRPDPDLTAAILAALPKETDPDA